MTKCFRSPIITIISRTIRPGHEQQYEEWSKGINAALASFAGSQGATVLRTGAGEREFHTLLQFDSPENLQSWLDSTERADWLARLEGITIDSEEVNSLTGMERWFTLPSQSVAQAPPRYKSALLILIALYPLSYLVPLVLYPLTRHFPDPLAKLLAMIITIVLMVWFAMPGLTRLFFWWLYPERRTKPVSR